MVKKWEKWVAVAINKKTKKRELAVTVIVEENKQSELREHIRIRSIHKRSVRIGRGEAKQDKILRRAVKVLLDMDDLSFFSGKGCAPTPSSAWETEQKQNEPSNSQTISHYLVTADS